MSLREQRAPKLTSQPKSHPCRETKQVQREGYVDSAVAVLGSSSPIAQCSSEFDSDLSYIDDGEHDERHSKPEEITVNLLSSFLQHAFVYVFCSTRIG